ncbi:phosphomannomutase/phosphoglucomutase [Hydrogenophilus thiooxidans]|uniref:phosphomannomutase/phosphoglucomutase n=1 Tax=Hydrogenophilus thiooxidans TaxID=2820326 RepID=UPI001C22AEE2|nr:phosphomannomutase/phosphoglucomutase [Hydrogenophilus thiooxidans]
MTPFVPDASIFKAYDIRGIVDRTLTSEAAFAIGWALGSEAVARGVTEIVIGRDGRLSGPALADALSRGIRHAGVGVITIGSVPTPVTYFAAEHLGTHSCVSVTGSHNPPEYNGFKMVLAGETLYGPLIADLRRRLHENDLVVAAQPATEREIDVVPAYLARITSDVHLARPMKIAIDCGNGVAGAVAPQLLTALGADVLPLYCDVDGTFPNHHPDPSKLENLRDLIATVTSGDVELGLAFDGDGDRLGVVTPSGAVIFPDRQLMLFAADLLARNPGATILYDVKCTRHLAPWIRNHGGTPLMWKTGHAFIKQKLKTSGALLAGEMSGHLFFKERWYGFDDGLYAAARLLEILSRADNPSALLENLPDSLATPELNIKMGEGEPHQLVEKLQHYTGFTGATEIITLDGVRVEYPDGFGLARASNTTPVLVLRFEAENEAALARIQRDFAQALAAVWPGIDLTQLSQ